MDSVRKQTSEMSFMVSILAGDHNSELTHLCVIDAPR